MVRQDTVVRGDGQPAFEGTARRTAAEGRGSGAGRARESETESKRPREGSKAKSAARRRVGRRQAVKHSPSVSRVYASHSFAALACSPWTRRMQKESALDEH